MTRRFRRFVALGDSQTEGVGDLLNADGTPRGWADRFADRLADAQGGELLYANLAVRGRRVAEVRVQQLPAALALEPDLASVIAGLNDVIRPRFDLDATLAHIEEIQCALAARGTLVFTATIPDLSPISPVARLVRRRLERFNEGVRERAAARGTLLVDVASWPLAASPQMWCEDRLHLSPHGHERLADALAAAVLEDGAPLGTLARAPRVARDLRRELVWARRYFMPWAGRRLTGRSSGDGRRAKRPALTAV
jgi:lysophospholipase L1-like esterase